MIRGAGGYQRLLQESFPFDISSYSVKFQQCQGVKTPQTDENGVTTIVVKRYALFRLCPGHACSSCHQHYGEYALDLEEYMDILSRYFHETKESMCQTCEKCNSPAGRGKAEASLVADFGNNCNECAEECHMLNQLEEKGYIDATEFRRCSPIYTGPNDEKFYAGPVCTTNGEGVGIGVFTDSYCSIQDTGRNIRDFLQTNDGRHVTLAYSFMKLAYRETCLSCQEDRMEGMHDMKEDEQDGDSVKKFCERLYLESDKCEAAHGFALSSEVSISVENLAEEQHETCALIPKIKAHGRSPNDSDAEDLIDSGLEGDEQSQLFAKQSLIFVGVGGTMAFVLMMIFKRCCGATSVSSAPENEVEPIKSSTENQDITEESSSSAYEESGILSD